MAGVGRLRRAVRWNVFEAFDKVCSEELAFNPSLILRTHKSSPKKIAVVLTAHVDRLGKPGDIVEVKRGYFRNYLLPAVLALPNIPKYQGPLQQYLKMFPEYMEKPEEKNEDTVETAEAEANSQIRDAQAAARRLDKGSIVFYRDVKEKTEIHRPITIEDVVDEVARQLNVHITQSNLKMSEAISTFGEIEMPLVFPREVPLPNERTSISLKIRVRRK